MKKNASRHRYLPQKCVLVIALSMLAACAPEIENRGPAQPVVEAVFNSDEGLIPTPNDLALGTVAARAGRDSAEAEFYAWLSGLNGWPAETGITIPFSGALKEESVTAESIRLYRIDAEGGTAERVAATIGAITTDDAGVVRVTLVPEAPLASGANYGVVVTKAIEDAEGKNIREPSAIYLASSRTPLVDENGRNLATILDSLGPERAQALEGMRQLLAPVFAAAEGDNVARTDVAMAFRWSVSGASATVLNPATRTLPIPNVLALDADGTFPDGGVGPLGERTAQSYFDGYLSRLHNWPVTTPITLPIEGDLDPATLTAENVQLWKLEASGEPLQAGIERIVLNWTGSEARDCDSPQAENTAAPEGVRTATILLCPEEPMGFSTEHFAFATRELKSRAGTSLVPPAAVYMGMQSHPVVGEDGKSLVSSLTDDNAASIARVQGALAPVMAHIKEATGLTHLDLSAVWNWTTWTDTFVVFDPSTGSIPFPNAALISGDRVNLPTDGLEGIQLEMFQEINRRAGFSVLANGWLPLIGELQADTVTYENIPMAYVPVGQSIPRPMTAADYAMDYQPDISHLVFSPTKPLRPGTLHAGIVSTNVKGINGRPVQPSPIFVFIRSPFPVASGCAEGEEPASLVTQLDDPATACALESARQAYSRLFQAAALLGYDNREDVSMAFAFTTDTPTRELQELRAVATSVLGQRDNVDAYRACEPTPEGCATDEDFDGDVAPVYTNPAGHAVDMSHVGKIHWAGEFHTAAFLDSATGGLRQIDASVAEAVGISVFVPRTTAQGGNCEPPFDTVIMQHGLGGERREAGVAMANTFAGRCLATVVMDLPIHGGRSVGSDTLHPTTPPSNSGDGFLSGEFIRTLNNFKQGVVDLVSLTRVIEGREGVSGLEGLIDQDDATQYFSGKAGYMGISLGGIIGTLFVTVEPAVESVVLNVAGGKLTLLLAGDENGSTIGAPILEALAEQGIVEGSMSYIQTMTFVQWLADAVDPVAFADNTINKPLKTLSWNADADFSELADGVKNQVLMQMAVNDNTVPNASTQMLAAAMGVSLEHTTFDNVSHGFVQTTDTNAAQFAAAQCAREQAAQWIASGLGGEAELPAGLQAAACLAR